MLLVFALPEEAGNEFTDYECLFTGIGKINAAYMLTKRLGQKTNINHRMIINLGTAGGAFNGIVNPTEFHEGIEDQFKDGPYKGKEIEGFPHQICTTSDYFVKSEYGIVDMEAFALAKICAKENLQFLCLKYVTDNGSKEDWQQNLKKAPKELKQALKRIQNAL